MKSESRRKLSWGTIATVPSTVLRVEPKWTPLFEAPTIRPIGGPFVLLGEMARVSRGIATGANEFFTLTDKEVKQRGIEPGYLVPVIPGARYVWRYDFTSEDWEALRTRGGKAHLLWCFKQKEELVGTKVLEYIGYGEKMGYNQRYLTRTRKAWYWVERREPAPILFTYMIRKEPRFIWNLANAYALNTLHGVYFPEDIVKDEASVKALLAYLNSGITKLLLREVGRVYGGGLVKAEPRELEKLPALNPLLLKPEDRDNLARLYDKLRAAIRVGDDPRKIKDQIDSYIKLLTGLA